MVEIDKPKNRLYDYCMRNYHSYIMSFLLANSYVIISSAVNLWNIRVKS